MAKKRSTGMSKRVGFLDADVIRENREILRENREAAKIERENEKWLRAESAARDIEAALRVHDLPHISEGMVVALRDVRRAENFHTITDNGWKKVDAEDIEAAREEWAVFVHAVASRLNRDGVRVPRSALVMPDMPNPLRRELLRAGQSVEGSARVTLGLVKLVDRLLSGDLIMHASEVSWREVQVNPNERARVRRIWGDVSRAVSDVWARDHDDALPSRAEVERAERERAREKLVKAGGAVDSWPIFSFEGEKLIDALVAGKSWEDAVAGARLVLGERINRVSEVEWKLIEIEWKKIEEALSHEANRRRNR